jgi:Kdo2-lipid IVA lauroyltransferase/acyltransferase
MLNDLRHKLEFLILLFFIGLVRLMPLDAATAFWSKVIRTIAPRSRRHRRALANLAMAYPDKSPEEREAIALAMWDNVGRVFAETILMDKILKEPERLEIENPELLARYKGKLGGNVFASLHMGNWEVAAWPLRFANARVAAVYRLVHNPYVDLYLRSKRKDLYPEGLFARGSANGMMAGHMTARVIGSYVRSGGKLAVLADLADWKGIQVPFFGHPAWSSTVPAMLARRIGARLWVGRCIRIGKESRFRVCLKEVKVPWTDNPAADIAVITADIQREFEAFIREHPEQWMWSNKRWSDQELAQVGWQGSSKD